MSKIKTKEANKIMMEHAEKLEKDSLASLTTAENALDTALQQAAALVKKAKDEYHVTLITSNRMKKQALKIRAVLDDEQVAEVKEDEQAAKDWSFQSVSALNTKLKADKDEYAWVTEEV